MSYQEPVSKVSWLMRQISEEYEAAQRGLSGLAQGVAQHEWITARLEQMSRHHDELKRLVGEQEAASFLVEVWEQK